MRRKHVSDAIRTCLTSHKSRQPRRAKMHRGNCLPFHAKLATPQYRKIRKVPGSGNMSIVRAANRGPRFGLHVHPRGPLELRIVLELLPFLILRTPLFCRECKWYCPTIYVTWSASISRFDKLLKLTGKFPSFPHLVVKVQSWSTKNSELVIKQTKIFKGIKH
jgi:hypothetical protein